MTSRQKPQLKRGAQYLTPTGKLCVWVPQAANDSYLLFRYTTPITDGKRHEFTLMPQNLHILKEIA